MPRIFVLRLGHRILRDKRTTTHCALVARAFGADGMIFSGDEDSHMMDRVKNVVRSWGGNFDIAYEPKWESFVKKWKEEGGVVVHCTMYGERIQDILDELRKDSKDRNVLLVIGSEKVPGKMYLMADYNVAVTNQPHSEIAALALVLDRLFDGAGLEREYPGAKLRVVPQKRGKKIEIVG